MLQSAAMARVRRRYTTVDNQTDWIVSVAYEESALSKSHWFEAKVSAVNEASGTPFAFPNELATYRIGETEHTFQQIVKLDWNGDRDAAIDHFLSTIFRRTYAYIERGH